MTFDFDPLWARIKDKMQNPTHLLQPNACAQSQADAWHRLGSTQHELEITLSKYVMVSGEQSILVKREGDILLGFFIEGQILEFSTEIGGNLVHKSVITEDGFYPVLSSTFVPLICLGFHDVRLVFEPQAGTSSDINLQLVFGHLSHIDRRALCVGMNTKPLVTELMDKRALKISSGMGKVVDSYDEKDLSCTHLPNVF